MATPVPRPAPDARPELARNRPRRGFPTDFPGATPKFPCGTQLASSRTSPDPQFRPQRPAGALIPAPHRMRLVAIAPQSRPGRRRRRRRWASLLELLPRPPPYPSRYAVFRMPPHPATPRSRRSLSRPPALTPALPPRSHSVSRKGTAYTSVCALRIPLGAIRVRPTPSRGSEEAGITHVCLHEVHILCVCLQRTHHRCCRVHVKDGGLPLRWEHPAHVSLGICHVRSIFAVWPHVLCELHRLRIVPFRACC